MSSTGSIRVDLHIKVLTDRVVARAKSADIDAVVYAPHFVRLPEIKHRATHFSDDDLLVIPGREVFTGPWTSRKHVVALGLTEPVPDYITLPGAMEEFARQDAVILVPHPTFASVSLTEHDIEVYRDRIHAIETYNPKHFSIHNRRARALSDRFGLPAFASSYAHLRGTVGEAWTEFPDGDPTEHHILDALRYGTTRSVHHRTGVAHRLRCSLEFSHLFYENTISKLAYSTVKSRGTLPTHPVYAGRFDSVAVY